MAAVSLFWWGWWQRTGGLTFSAFYDTPAGLSVEAMRGIVIYYQYDENRPANLSLNIFVGCGASSLSDSTVLSLSLVGLIRRTASHQAHCQYRMGTSDQSDLRHFWRRYASADPTPASSPYAHAVYAAKKPCWNQIRFQYILNGFTFFANGCRRVIQTYWPATKNFIDYRQQQFQASI